MELMDVFSLDVSKLGMLGLALTPSLMNITWLQSQKLYALRQGTFSIVNFSQYIQLRNCVDEYSCVYENSPVYRNSGVDRLADSLGETMTS
jgi:hypothetical protein